MKRIIKYSVTRALVSTMIAIALTFISSSVMAYGPERQTFTMANPADYVTFNSITDNPVLGDERNFVRIAEDNSNSAYKDEIKLVPGKVYELYIGYHNNAKSSLNQNGSGIARGAKVAVQYPVTVSPSQSGTISAILSAVNANPKEVWDGVTITSDTELTLNYVVGSAKIYNDWKANGSVLSTAIFSEEGTYLGLNELNGLLPGCAEYSGHILIKFKANTTEAKIDKSASLDGENFSKEVKAKPGDEITFKVSFTNTGTTDLHNVTFHDELPEGLSLVEGTTYLKYSTENTANKMTDLIATNGYNTGTYGPGTGATITYKVKVSENQDFCGNLVNKIFLDHDNGELTDGAIVAVEGENCKPVYDCETNPDLPECQVDNCENNPTLPGCQEKNCENNPSLPECQEKNCKTNPEMEGCQELPSTGPLEIIMAIIIILGIGGGGYYFYRSRKTLNKTENKAKGKNAKNTAEETPKQEEEPVQIAKDSSQNKDNMVK